MGRPTTRSMQRARRPGARPASPHFHEVEGEVEADQARDAFLSHAGREPTQMAHALGLTDGATRASVVSRLQQTQGNAYVQRLVQATLQVQRDKTKAKPPPPPPQFAVDGDGFINRVSDGMRVGRQDDSGAFVAVDASGKHIVPWLEAGVGSLSLSADQAGASFILGGSILRMKAAQVKPVAAAADATAAAATQVNVKLTGTAIGMLFDEGSGLLGGKMLSWGGKWTPVAPEATPERVKTRLTAQSRIALEGGEFWTLMDYRLRDEKKSKQRWVAAGHPLSDFQKHSKDLSAEAKKLPTDLQTKVEEHLKLMALVATHEGSFGATSGAGDDTASLGIFQWGKKKNVTSDKGASLARFFRDLQTRASEAEKTPADKRSEEQKLYINAWQQCDNKKMTVDGDTIKINGKVATGGDVEQKMKGEMGKGALRRYQLVAALDWIETFKATLVRPGGNGIGFVGHGYEDVAAGTGAHLKSSSATADYTFDLAAPDDAVTVGDLFSAEKSLAAAVILGVNRPHYVETALWRALNPAGDVKTEAETHLAALVQALDVPAPPGKKSKKKAKRTITQADIAGLDDAAKAHYETLRRLIWPSAADSASVNEEQLLAEFERQALPLYKAADARKFRRAERFGTVEAAFESPAWNK